MRVCTWLALTRLVVFTDRPTDYEALGRGKLALQTDRSLPTSRVKTRSKSLQITSISSLVSLKMQKRAKAQQETTPSNRSSGMRNFESAQPVTGKEANEQRADGITDSEQAARPAEVESDASLAESDNDKVLEVLPAVKNWMEDLRKAFTDHSGTSCVKVKGTGELRYGCGWKPADRSNMTVKDTDQALCSCNYIKGFQQCYQPDADDIVSYIKGKEKKKAEGFAKDYLAGRCYTPIYVWVIISLMVLGKRQRQRWSGKGDKGGFDKGGWTFKKKVDDSRVAGSTWDTNRNLGS